MDKFKAINSFPTGTRLRTALDLKKNSVDRKFGDGAGAINGLAVITRGEALGHELWIDSEFLSSLVAEPTVKARFTHPGLSSDGLGRLLGRARNFSQDGDVVRGDLQFLKSAHNTPDGNLAEYIMNVAEESPDLAGLSIVFGRNAGAEKEFFEAHRTPSGAFKSPDPDNVKNFRHIRLDKLLAIDVVDDPAANPDGLFSSGFGTLEDIEKTVAFALGLSDERPAEDLLGAHPERAKSFVAEFLSRHELEIKTVGATGGEPSEERESDMEFSDLTAEMLSKERPDLVEGFRDGLIGSDAVERFVDGERERCLSIWKEACGLHLDATGIDATFFEAAQALIKDGSSADSAIANLRGAALDEMRKGVAENPGENPQDNGGEKFSSDGDRLDADIQKYMKENPTTNYGDAMAEVERLRAEAGIEPAKLLAR